MSEQEQTQSPTKVRRVRQSKKLNGSSPQSLQRPANDDDESWREYWKERGEPWRIAPEISEERQQYLDQRRKITPEVEKGIYPFKNIRLSRADVEWLLSTHQSEGYCGPVNWNDESQYLREGLDLRGADLRQKDLSWLPLARTIGGHDAKTESEVDEKYYAAAAIHLEGTILSYAHLEGSNLIDAHLKRAALDNAHLEDVLLIEADMENANLFEAHLRNAKLGSANLRDADLSESDLRDASLTETHLERAGLIGCRLEGADFPDAHLEGADITDAFLDGTTGFYRSSFYSKEYGPVALADVHWRDVNVAVVDWSKIPILGDEVLAKERNYESGQPKSLGVYIQDHQTAVRAYRQLSIELRSQGLNEDATRFIYRAQVLQRQVYRLQHQYSKYLGLLFLDLIAGYGYKFRRSFLVYLIVIFAFATAYFIIGRTVGPSLSPLGSLVFSMTSFHGRGFFPGGIKLDDPLTVLAAVEALVGLMIEVTFIATLTQRLFGK